jgi:O-acetyl-ADP-ribose deacetylase (regulator of RNase III)
MIKHIKGDLLNCKANVLIHVCNCFHTFGAGIALKIKNKYPEAYEADLKTKSGDKNKLGTFSWARTPDKKIIINLYGQYNSGRNERQLNYEAFYTGLEAIRERLAKSDPTKITVGFPYKIGCNLAGGNFVIVETMIREIFKDESYDVLIVEYAKI